MSEAENASNPILIVGGGPTGLVMAGELARHRVPFRLIDVSRSASDKSKAIGIQARTLELFEISGIAARFTSAGLKVTAVNIYHDERKLAHIRFDDLDSEYRYVLTLPQSDTENILIDHLEGLGGSIEREVKLLDFTQDESGVTARLLHSNGNIETTRTQWLVGCDGAHSTVRHQLDLPFLGEQYEEGFQLADVKILWLLKDDEVHLFIHDGWVLGAFPLPDGHHRLIADCPPEQAPLDKAPTLEHWQKIVDERTNLRFSLSDPRWTANYRIHRRLVSKLQVDRAFLVGDAAHIHSPAGAQGMNTGIQDAYNLAWKLALVFHGIAPKTLLSSYHAERYPVEKAVLNATDLPLHIVGLTNKFAQAVRDRVIPFLAGLDSVQHKIGEMASEIAVNYVGSPIVEEHSLGGGPKAGERAPNGDITTPDGSKTTLFSLLASPEHKLLIFDQTKPEAYALEESEAMAIFLRDHFRGLVKTYRISQEMTNGTGTLDGRYLDRNNCLAERYGAKRGAAYLIRPDGYIAFRAPLDCAAEKLQTYINRLV